jgi:hypothetical protein
LTRIFTARAAVKENASLAGSLYERRKPRRAKPALFFVLLLVVFLLVLHFLNLFLQWTVIRLELAHGPVFRSPEYSFFGFSLFNQKEIAAVRYFKNSSQPTRVFSFFDFFHPAIFAIWNKNETAFIDLGPIVTAVPTGFSRVSFFPGAVFFLQQGKKIGSKYFGDAIVGRTWHSFLDKKVLSLKGDDAQIPGSFVVKSLETSRYLKIPYLLYFFLPLLLIFAAVIRFGPGMLSAFLYYVEMFFLFDYQNLFVTVPFGWISKSVNLEISETATKFFAAALAIVFVVCAILGFWHWKKREISAWQKIILLFFVLLPLVLYF